MDLTVRLRAWTYGRHLLGRSGAGLLETIEHLVGVYSTHPSAPLSLLARTDFVAEDLVELEMRRAVVRLPGMRGSLFLLPRTCADRIFSATRMPPRGVEQRLRALGIGPEVYARLAPAVLQAASEPVTPEQVRRAVGEGDTAVLVMRTLARDGQILRLSANMRVDQLRYVATAAWLGGELAEVPRGEALAWLADRYLRFCGPARLADFAWWAGVPRRAAAEALGKCATLSIGEDLLMRADDAEEFGRVRAVPGDHVDVLPKWDAYTMAYAPDGRQRLIDDAHLALAYTARVGSPGATAGDGLPLVLLAGRAVATWTHRLAGKRIDVQVTPFPGLVLPTEAVEAAFERVGALLRGLPRVSFG